MTYMVIRVKSGRGAMADGTDGTWSIAEAKAKFSELIERARDGGPQIIKRRGRAAAVVVGAEEWQRKAARDGTLAGFFARSPLRRARLRIARVKDGPRRAGR
jgi:prevent-host-death family protein